MIRKFAAMSLITFSSALLHATQITVNVVNPVKNPPVLYLPDGKSLPIELDAQGQGQISFNLPQAGYVKVGYNYTTRLFWVDATSTLNLSFHGDSFYKDIQIQGDHLKINKYLNGEKLPCISINDTELPEDRFLQKADSLLQSNLAYVKKLNLPESFKQTEAKRLVYYTYQALPSYQTFHRRICQMPDFNASDAYWNKLKEATAFDGQLLSMEDYQSYLLEAVGQLSRHAYPELKKMDRLTAFLTHHVQDAKITEYLVYRQVYSYVKRNGLDDAESYLKAFDTYVKDNQMKGRFQQLCDQINSLNPGAFSVDFNATNLKGETVSLKELKGNYVFIDIWATWCVPCRKELPFMKKLEEKYHDAPIRFVSISCDTNRKAWEKKVTQDQLKGIQLIFSDDSFMKKYMVQGIPRFILLDQEGRILSAEMTRPSDPTTTKALDELLK